MATLQCYFLGHPRLEQDQCVLHFPRRKAQALFIYLAVTGEPQTRATLATLLWPERDEQHAFGSLRRHLSELNKILGRGWIEGKHDTVHLTPNADIRLDVSDFAQQLAMCRQHGHAADRVCPACIAPLTAAVACYHGDFLTGFTLPDAPAFDEWQFFQSEALRRLLSEALDRLVQAYMAQGEPGAAIPYARRRLAMDPLHEAAHRQLMQIYAATGQYSAALRQYDVCVETLQEELGIAPDAETSALYTRLHRGLANQGHQVDDATHRSAHALRHNLPAPTTPFVGRATEVAELTRRCRDPASRLITILGPGGIGKTRLALEAAAQLTDDMPDGVFLVPLVQLANPAHIAPAIAGALNLYFLADGRPAKQQLLDFLQQKHLLLLLDNFEHLLNGVDLLQDLLEASPAVHLLVTSRERLQLTGETVFTLGSLAFPTWEQPSDLLDYDAIQLFMQTAQRVRPGVSWQDEELQYVARICRLVGGIPLGVILAAGWIELLSPAQIAAELTQGVDLLEMQWRDLPERQRSMRTVFAYSWRQLTEIERDAFMRLSVFRGGFTRDAAQMIAGATVPVLARLVDKSFVQRIDDERFDIHELLRQYAAQQFADTGAQQLAQDAHSAYYLAFLHQCEPALAGPGQIETIAALEADFENIRAAWQWAVQRRRYALVDWALEGLFRWFWLKRSRQLEGQALLRHALVQWTPESGQAPHPVWARITARIIEQQQGSWLTAVDNGALAQALAIARQQDNQAEVAFCLWVLGLAFVSERHGASFIISLAPAISLYEQSLTYFRNCNDRFYMAQVLENLGHCHRVMGQLGRAVPCLQESLEIRCKAGDRFGMTRSLRELGFAAWVAGLAEKTQNFWREAYEILVELDEQQGLADTLFFLSVLSLNSGDWQRARKLANEVMTIAAAIGNRFYQSWAERALVIAMSMEQDARCAHHHSCSYPNIVTAFTARLFFALFAQNLTDLRLQLDRLWPLAESEVDTAVCLVLAARLLAGDGDERRAVQVLALAFRYPNVADGWIGSLPEIGELQEQLKVSLSPSEFERARIEGQQIELQATAAELRTLLHKQNFIVSL